MSTITHTYGTPSHQPFTRVVFTALTLAADGSEVIGARTEALVAGTGAMSATLTAGMYVVEHVWFEFKDIPSGWNGTRYVNITADADLMSLVGYVTVDDLRISGLLVALLTENPSGSGLYQIGA